VAQRGSKASREKGRGKEREEEEMEIRTHIGAMKIIVSSYQEKERDCGQIATARRGTRGQARNRQSKGDGKKAASPLIKVYCRKCLGSSNRHRPREDGRGKKGKQLYCKPGPTEGPFTFVCGAAMGVGDSRRVRRGKKKKGPRSKRCIALWSGRNESLRNRISVGKILR